MHFKLEKKDHEKKEHIFELNQLKSINIPENFNISITKENKDTNEKMSYHYSITILRTVQNSYSINISNRKGQIETPKVYYINTNSEIKDHQLITSYENLRMKSPESIQKITQAMSILDPHIQDCSIFMRDSGPMFFLKKDQNYYPLFEFGQGTSRWLKIILSMAWSSHGLCLIDEIENGFHTTFNKKAIENLVTFSNLFHTQLFLTTHSLELIEQFVTSDCLNTHNFSFYKIQNIKVKTIFNSFSKNEISHFLENEW